MLEHVQPIADAVRPAPARTLPRGRRALSSRFSWVLSEGVLFPVVALYLISLSGSLPHEILSDTWYAIVGGREVAQHGLPTHDTLTVWGHGHRWVDEQWLGQLAIYGLYAAGGIKLASLGHVVALGVAFVAAVAAARWRGGSPRSVCWISVPAFFLLIWGSWNVRAQSLAFILFVAVVWLLVADARAPSRRVFLVFPLLALWGNVHGTAVTGALLVSAAGACYGFERRRRALRTWVPRTALMVIAPFACLLASPYATSLPGYYHKVLSDPWFKNHIIEWQPTMLSIRTGPFYLLALLTVWFAGRCRDRLSLTEKALLACTLVLGLQTIRSIVWFTLVALMLLPTALDAVLKPNDLAARRPLLNRVLIAASVAGVVVVFASVAAKPTSWFEGNYPPAALAAVARVEAADPHVRVFANQQYGDWLLLRRPELRGRIAYDVRYELLPKARLDQLTDARELVLGWQRDIAGFGLFVLRDDGEHELGQALLSERGARQEYRGHGLVVIYRPARKAK